MLNNTKLCIFLKTVIKLCYMNWHLVKLYAMKIKCKTFVIPLSIFQNVFTVICPFLWKWPNLLSHNAWKHDFHNMLTSRQINSAVNQFCPRCSNEKQRTHKTIAELCHKSELVTLPRSRNTRPYRGLAIVKLRRLCFSQLYSIKLNRNTYPGISAKYSEQHLGQIQQHLEHCPLTEDDHVVK